MDRAVFAEHVVRADFESGGFPNVFEILGFPANGSEGEKFVAFSEAGGAFENDMIVEHTIITKGDIGANDAVRADSDVVSELGFGRNDCGWVDHLRILKRGDCL